MACGTVLVDPFDSLDSNPVQHMQLSKGEIMTGWRWGDVMKQANKNAQAAQYLHAAKRTHFPAP